MNDEEIPGRPAAYPIVKGADWLGSVMAVAPRPPSDASYAFGADDPHRPYYLTVYVARGGEIGCMIRAQNEIARLALVDLERTLKARDLPCRMETDGWPPATWRLYFPRPEWTAD